MNWLKLATFPILVLMFAMAPLIVFLQWLKERYAPFFIFVLDIWGIE